MKLLLLLLLQFVPNRQLDGIFPERPANFLTDVAGVVKQPDAVNAALQQLQVRDTLQLAAVVLPTIRQRAPDEVALEIGRRWKVAQLGELGSTLRNTGGVILIVLDSRDCRVEVARGSEGYMTDSRAAQACRDAAQYFRTGDFGSGIVAIAETFARYHRREVAQAAAARLPKPPSKPWPWGTILLGLLFFGAVTAFIGWPMLARRRRQRALEDEAREKRAAAAAAQRRAEQERLRVEQERLARERQAREAARWASLTPAEREAELKAEEERRKRADAERRRREEAERQAAEQRRRNDYNSSSSSGSFGSSSGGFGGFGGSSGFSGGGGGAKW